MARVLVVPWSIASIASMRRLCRSRAACPTAVRVGRRGRSTSDLPTGVLPVFVAQRLLADLARAAARQLLDEIDGFRRLHAAERLLGEGDQRRLRFGCTRLQLDDGFD